MEIVYFIMSIVFGFICGLPIVFFIKFLGRSSKKHDDSTVPRLCPVVGDECPKSEGYNDCEHCSIFRG